MNLFIQKEQEGQLYENGAGKNIVGYSELKLWTFLWGHDQCSQY